MTFLHSVFFFAFSLRSFVFRTLFRLVIPSSLSVASLSRSTSSHYTAPLLQCVDDQRSSHSTSQDSSDHSVLLGSDSLMTDADHCDPAYQLTSSSSNSLGASEFDEEEEEENNLSFTRTLFTSPEQRRAGKGNTSDLSSVSTLPSQESPELPRDFFSQEREKNQQQQSKLSVNQNTSIISSRRRWQWKQNASGLPRNVFVNDNNSSSSDGEDDAVICSSSFSSAAPAAATAAVAADCSSRRQRRKQTRLKKKTPLRERKEEKKKTMKKERNKKSPSSSSSIEAAEASLFQCFALDTTRIGTQLACDPNEQPRCVDRNAAPKENGFSMQTSLEHQQQVRKSGSPRSLTLSTSRSKKRKGNRIIVFLAFFRPHPAFSWQMIMAR